MNKTNRASGLILHISSLPGKFGIGTLGKEAFGFVDFLKKAGQTYWQILPLGPTGYADSPYQSFSAAAGNPYFIDFDLLAEEGIKISAENTMLGADPDKIDYGKLFESREKALREAFAAGYSRQKDEIYAFVEKNSEWLPDYAFFMAIKGHFGMVPLSDWPDADIKLRKPDAVKRYKSMLAEDIEYHCFVQYNFYKQWDGLRRYANDNGVRIIGDIPIYVSPDSAEVWSKPELFLLDSQLNPKKVAGVPPDSFSETGQLWGNPIYDWDYIEKTGFKWWIWRVKQMFKLYDTVRIDHFRGFESYWEVPYGDKTAEKGKWRKGPAMRFIDALRNAVPDTDIIAEDLGDIDDDVRKFVEDSAFPGMKVLVDAFNDGSESDFLPHNYTSNSICYTSTHDTPTFLQWFVDKADARQRKFCGDYARIRLDEGICWGAIKTAWISVSRIAMAPMQDILGLGADTRMNFPSVTHGNWAWRIRKDALNGEVAAMIFNITEMYGRAQPLK